METATIKFISDFLRSPKFTINNSLRTTNHCSSIQSCRRNSNTPPNKYKATIIRWPIILRHNSMIRYTNRQLVMSRFLNSNLTAKIKTKINLHNCKINQIRRKPSRYSSSMLRRCQTDGIKFLNLNSFLFISKTTNLLEIWSNLRQPQDMKRLTIRRLNRLKFLPKACSKSSLTLLLTSSCNTWIVGPKTIQLSNQKGALAIYNQLLIHKPNLCQMIWFRRQVSAIWRLMGCTRTKMLEVRWLQFRCRVDWARPNTWRQRTMCQMIRGQVSKTRMTIRAGI